MKKFLFSLSLISCISLHAQNSIPNGNFESWLTTTYTDLDGYVTPVVESQQFLGSTTVIRSTDKVSGSYSLRMETKTNGIDTIFGFITAGEFGQSNGFAFSQSPDSLVGYYKSGIAAGDTAVFLVDFSSLGNSFFDTVFTFVGSQATWSRFAFPVNLSQAPDSCFIAMASSNAINDIGVQPGSWLMVDSIAFSGGGVTQSIPNFDFENWITDTSITLNDWAFSEAVSRTSDNQEGTYALKLETKTSGGGTSYILYNGQVRNGTIEGGHPFNIMTDTLIGHYKYLPSGGDTAALSMNFSRNGSLFAQQFYLFQAQPTYVNFSIPFSVSQMPDSMFLVIASSLGGINIGSTLYLDDLKLKSIVTSLNKEINGLSELVVYPNPTTENLNIDFDELVDGMIINVVDGIGRLHYSTVIALGNSTASIEVSNLKNGVYYLQFVIDDKITYRQFIKQ